MGQFIPLHYHFAMLQDNVRTSAFATAIDWMVRPGMNVLELGGGTGILSYLAAKRGAEVRCVERLPPLAQAARKFLNDNGVGDRVEIIEGDAREYLPPEPVDVVICEMLHVGLVREQQVAVIESFKERYQEQFGPRLPIFIPEASLLGMQLVQQCYEFQGYQAAIPMFQTPGVPCERTQPLSEPKVYEVVMYGEELPDRLAWNGLIPATQAGTFNAVRFVTQNVLGHRGNPPELVEWSNQFLVLPIAQPRHVATGELVPLRFEYRPGQSLEALSGSLTSSHSFARMARRAAA